MSVDGTYKVSWASQFEAASFVQTAINSINSDLQGINAETQALLGRWDDSTSRAAYTERQTRWTNAANEIVTALEAFKRSLDTSGDISSATETKSSNEFGA